MQKLFYVYLGGKEDAANTELHDSVFVAGEKIEDTFDQLREAWFGQNKKIHIDAWRHLDIVDGYEIELKKEKTSQEQNLYFVNLGAYKPGRFHEIHEDFVIVASSGPLAKKEAKLRASKDLVQLHKDHVFEVENCLKLSEINGLHIHLKPTNQKSKSQDHVEYMKMP